LQSMFLLKKVTPIATWFFCALLGRLNVSTTSATLYQVKYRRLQLWQQ
jgi:hypothetical protein